MGIGDINPRSHLSVDFARSHISVSLDNDAQHLKGVNYVQKSSLISAKIFLLNFNGYKQPFEIK